MCKITLGLKECDKLDGASNFVPWKIMFSILMEEVDLWKHAEKNIPKLTNQAQLEDHRNKGAKVKRIILGFLKDHFISHIVDKTSSKSMLDALVKLFHNYCAS